MGISRERRHEGAGEGPDAEYLGRDLLPPRHGKRPATPKGQAITVSWFSTIFVDTLPPFRNTGPGSDSQIGEAKWIRIQPRTLHGVIRTEWLIAGRERPVHISRIHLSAMVVLTVSLMASNALSDRIYWTELTSHSVIRADLVGTNQEVLIEYGGNSPMAIALDEHAGKMYWTSTGEIQRANLDGTEVEPLITGLPSAKGLALDLASGKMYWASVDPTGCINRSNLDGTDTEIVLEQDASWLALDADSDTIYWTTAGAVRRADLNTRNTQSLVESTPGMAFEAIALDVGSGKMYWVESAAQRIRWGNLDGSEVSDCITGLNAPIGLAVDAYHGMIYWTDMGSIHRANLDCTNLEPDVVSYSNWPAGITLQVDCGNGVLDTGETCDVAIPAGNPGTCPTNCNDVNTCTVDSLLDAGTCTVICRYTPITSFIDDDGCCPPGADANADNDCDPACGNGACEEGEEEADCPQDCGRAVPAVSQWGLLSLALSLLAGARIRFGRRQYLRGAPATK